MEKVELGFFLRVVRTCNYEVELTHYPKQYRILMHKRYIAVENNVRKGEIACNKQFLIFYVFYPSALIFHFKCILKCRLQFVPIWTSLNDLVKFTSSRGDNSATNESMVMNIVHAEL